MGTDYIDLYFIHGVRKPEQLSDELKAWAERTKKAGTIKHFGFSTHTNMQELMTTAAKAGWIDGIMMTYNFRLMFKDDMKRAVEACDKAGVGLCAMKTQAKRAKRDEGEAAATEEKLIEKFIDKGYSEEQAKLKAVWEIPAIASICSLMRNMSQLSANVAAAVDKTKLALGEKVLLRRLASETCDGYCAGCASKCEPLAGGPVADVMRSLMYYHNYGDPQMARETFAQVAPAMGSGLGAARLRAAEAACPNKLPIGEMIDEARRLLA
jgi:predicted aldo/keto reductase-like oxidoreductase